MQNWPLQAVASGTGVATVSLPARGPGQRLKVTFINVQSDSGTESVAQVFLNRQPIIATSKGNLDSASGEPSIDLTGKDDFTIQWTGCTAGAHCTAVVWYDNAVH